MRKNRKYDWPKLINEFKNSGQSQTQFCKDRDINACYFNQKLRQQSLPDKSKFVAIVPTDHEGTRVEGLTVTVGRCIIHCPATMPLQSITTLVRTLA